MLLHECLLLGAAGISNSFQEPWVYFLLVLTDCTRHHLFLFLHLDRELEVKVELLLRCVHDGASIWQHFLQDVVGLLLALQCLAELLGAIVAKSDGLVGACSLDVLLSKHVLRLIQVLHVRLKGGIHLINLLVDQTHLQVDAGDLWMVLTNAVVKDV